MNKKKLKPKRNRDELARHQAKTDNDMKMPVNKFMNEKDEAGKVKYPIAQKLRNYFLSNPDPIFDAMRLTNSLVHEIRWHKEQAKRYLVGHKSFGEVTMRDKTGQTLTKEECYTAYIKERQLPYVVLSKLRTQITAGLLPKVDNDLFTFQQFNDFILDVEKIVESLGYVLFPTKVENIKTL